MMQRNKKKIVINPTMIEISNIKESQKIISLLLIQKNQNMKNKHNLQIKKIEQKIN